MTSATPARSLIAQEAGKQFRRVNGHLHLRSLRDTLTKVTETVGATGQDETVNAA